MIQVDDKLNLILGNDIRVNDFLSLKQFKLKEISNIGFGEYLFRVSNILRDVDDFMKMFIDSPNYMDLYQQRNQLTALDMQLMVCTDDEYKKMFTSSLEFVLGLPEGSIEVEYDRLLYKNISSDEDVKLIDKETFSTIMNKVKVINGFAESKIDDDENPYDEKAKKMLEKLRRNREKVEQIKAKEKADSSRDIADIISAVTAMSPSTNKLNVLEYTLYQLYDEHSRLYAIEGYKMSVKASMYGGNEISDWGAPQ